MLKKNNNNKFKSGQRIISFFAILFILAVYFSFIPFDIIFNSSVKSCCLNNSETVEISSGKEFFSNACFCCSGVCRCAFKDKAPADIPFNGFVNIHSIPDFPEYGDNFFAVFNIFALIFNDNPPEINTGDFISKIPIYRLKSSMLC